MKRLKYLIKSIIEDLDDLDLEALDESAPHACDSQVYWEYISDDFREGMWGEMEEREKLKDIFFRE